MEAEQTLGLIHTTSAMTRAHAAIKGLPPVAEGTSSAHPESPPKVSISDSEDDAILEADEDMPDWLYANSILPGELEGELVKQFDAQKTKASYTDPMIQTVVNTFIESLKLQKLQLLQHNRLHTELKVEVDSAKDKIVRHLQSILPEHDMLLLMPKLKEVPGALRTVKELSTKMDKLGTQFDLMLLHQQAQTELLQQILLSVNPGQTLDGNKKGENLGGASKALVPSIPGTQVSTSVPTPIIYTSALQKLDELSTRLKGISSKAPPTSEPDTIANRLKSLPAEQ